MGSGSSPRPSTSIVERKVLGLALAATALGAAGLAFGYWILLPRAVHFLTNYDDTHFRHLIRASSYYNFVVAILVGIVVIFQTPLAILGLVAIGVLSSRTLRKQRRLGYFITAAIALALPGPDPVTTFLELLPMWLLFEGSIWLAWFVERRMAKVTPASATLGGMMARAMASGGKQQAKRSTRGRRPAWPATAQRGGNLNHRSSFSSGRGAPPEVGVRRARRRLRPLLRARGRRSGAGRA